MLDIFADVIAHWRPHYLNLREARGREEREKRKEENIVKYFIENGLIVCERIIFCLLEGLSTVCD